MKTCARKKPFYVVALAVAIAAAFQPASGDNRAGVPDWEVDPAFREDVFTFARVQYDSHTDGRGWGRRGRWAIDYPDAELNFAFRIQQMTSIKVNPETVVVRLDRDQDILPNYPFLYMIEPGYLVFNEEETVSLRAYLLNGGFLMIDDFWGEAEWDNFAYEMSRVFPDRHWVDLEIDHPIFNIVFHLTEKPQVPHLHFALSNRHTGRTWERDDAQEPNYRALYDDRGRIMAIACHNTDLGDGWEQEGESEWYFREFAEKRAYPMGINILFYALTH